MGISAAEAGNIAFCSFRNGEIALMLFASNHGALGFQLQMGDTQFLLGKVAFLSSRYQHPHERHCPVDSDS
jgi:hypothetical protein